MAYNRILSIASIMAFFCLIIAAAANAAGQDRIGLQDLRTRTIVYCYANSRYSAEDCASHYEALGYTRMRDIPSKTANYDFLTVDTFPTRRWRSGELTPRW